jgi:hypothetical protein
MNAEEHGSEQRKRTKAVSLSSIRDYLRESMAQSYSPGMVDLFREFSSFPDIKTLPPKAKVLN